MVLEAEAVRGAISFSLTWVGATESLACQDSVVHPTLQLKKEEMARRPTSHDFPPPPIPTASHEGCQAEPVLWDLGGGVRSVRRGDILFLMFLGFENKAVGHKADQES